MAYIHLAKYDRHWTRLMTAVALANVVLIAALLAGCTSTGPIRPETIPIGDYSYARDYTDHIVRMAMREHSLPSIAVALIDGQRVIHAKAFGFANVESGTVATTDTIYKMWSVSKVFTAIEIISGNITEFIPREALPKAIAVLDQIHEGIDVTVETIMVNCDGRISDFELDSVPIVFTANLSIKLNGGEKTIGKC